VTPSDEDILSAVAVQAGHWFVANQAGQLSAEENAAFLAWLKASPIHVQEYLGVARTAHHMKAAAGEPQVPLETYLSEARVAETDVVTFGTPAHRYEARTAHAPAGRGWRLAASLAALALFTASILWWMHDGELFGLPKTYRTARGQQSVQRLPDGSVLRLDTDSQATVRYGSRERVVELDRGQALFEVARDGQRRFRVVAGAVGVIAVGTQFDVDRQGGGTTSVIVAEGKVAVFTGEPAWLLSEGDAPPQVQRVTAGFQVRVDAEGASAQPVPVDLGQALAWAEHKIVFKHRPLGEVAGEFNRYGNIPVDIEDAELRALPVSGMFDAGDTDSFVAFLQTLPDVRVEKTPKRIRVIKVTPTT
jgi:transmembrane sensor